MALYQLNTQLIGINGEIGSGKDTVTAMLQEHPKLKHYNIQNVKFAGKLKKICAEILGVDPIQFEDQDFKKMKLPPIWAFYKIVVTTTVMKPVNQKRFGNLVKSTAKEQITFDRMPDGRAIRTEDDLEIMKEHLLKLYPACEEIQVVPVEYTYRQVLQYMGTDLLRNQFHPDIHVMATFADYQKQADEWDDLGNTVSESYPFWVISDTRFKNEAEHIRSRGGLVIRIERYQMDDLFTLKSDPSRILKVGYYDGCGVVGFDGNKAEQFCDYKEIRKYKPDAHASEKELDDFKFDHVIYNCESLDVLRKEVDFFVNNKVFTKKTVSNETAQAFEA